MRIRRAFSLVELLVVIGIVGILVGMLVPAVQRVREAASFAQCKNNMKQIGIACHVSQDSRGCLPQTMVLCDPDQFHSGMVAPWAPGCDVWGTGSYHPAWIPNNGTLSDKRSSHFFWDLLPFVEQHQNAVGAVDTYICPSRRNASAGPKVDYGTPASMFHEESCMFGANLGDGAALGYRPGSRTVISAAGYWTPSSPNSFGTLPADPTCIEFFWEMGQAPHYSNQLEGISDGFSQTILMAHKGLGPQDYFRSPVSVPVTDFGYDGGAARDRGLVPMVGFDYHTQNSNFLVQAATDIMRYPYAFLRDKKGGYYVDEGFWWGYPDNAPSYFFMTSPHATMPVLFCDGSVQTMSFTRDYSLDMTMNPFDWYSASEEVKLLTNLWRKNDGSISVVD